MSAHLTRVPVRWGDMDALGHVNNARFFTYDEDVRLGFFSDFMAGDDRFWTDYGLILARIGCDFIAQLRAPATLDVEYGFVRVGGSSFETQSLMRLDGKPMACVRATVVWFDYRAQRSLRIPDAIRERMEAHQVEPFAVRGG